MTKSIWMLFIISCVILPVWAQNPGDANNDGVLGTDDVRLVLDQILGKGKAPGSPDINNDGIINAADVVLLVKTIENIKVIALAQGVSMEFIRIPKGSFQMGSSDAGWSAATEIPVHSVQINYDFYLGRFEVTRLQWNVLMNTKPPDPATDNNPVENVSWDDCQTYIGKLNDLKQGTFRLPSEAEWEYACRAGSAARFPFGDSDCPAHICDTCKLDSYAWWCGNNISTGIKRAGSKSPNAFGIYDMMGNAMEWCRDAWHDDYTDAPADGSAWEEQEAFERVARGGYWDSDAADCRPSKRYHLMPDSQDEVTGVRIVLVIP